MNDNLAHYLEAIASAAPESCTVRGRGWLLVDSGIASDTFNKLLLTQVNADLDAALVATERLKAAVRPFTVWLTPEALRSDLPERLTDAGFAPAEAEEGMALDLDRDIEVRASELDICRVSTPEAFADLAMNLAANGDPPDVQVLNYYRLAAENLLEYQALVFFTGYAEGEPATTLQMCLHRNTAGLYSMSTLAAYRGRGYARAILVHALNWAREQGMTRAVLQASEDGEPVYRKLGFEDVGRYEEWQPV